MSDPKRRLLDALRDPEAAAVVKPKVERRRSRKSPPATHPVGKRKPTKKAAKNAAKKPRKPRRKKAVAPAPDWPTGWVLTKVRCRGITVTGTGLQCSRPSAKGTHFCGAHKKQTMKHVASEVERRSPSVPGKGSKAASQGAPGSTPEEEPKRFDLSKVPEARQCKAPVDGSDGETTICGGWTIEVGDKVYDSFCVNHSNDPRAVRSRDLAKERGAKVLDNYRDYVAAQRSPVFNREVKTQDDVAETRLMVMRKVEAGVMTPSQASVINQMLVVASAHIERYGTHQGAEGGAGVLRLLPGTTLVQQHTEIDTVLTKEQLDELEIRLSQDEKDGIPTPDDWYDVLEKYLGIKTRKRDHSRGWEG